MTKLNIEYIGISWGISRGMDTYGWNICRASSRQSGKVYRTCGGGYDMVGTVIADWFEAEHQNELLELVKSRQDQLTDAGYTVSGYKYINGLCGLVVRPDGSVSLDGGCGIESILRIINACGYDTQRDYKKNDRTRKFATLGYWISKEMKEVQ